MALIEAILKNTGCTDVSDLPSLESEQLERIAVVLTKISADCVPLKDWNVLLTAFGKDAQNSSESARELLIRTLTVEPDPVPEKTAVIPAETPPEKPTQPEIKKHNVNAAKQKSLFLRIWNIFTTVLVAIAVLLAVTLAGVRLFGLQVFTVLSGSMEPVYHVGSLIYVVKIDPTELAVGDDISFMLDEDTVATHRIVGIMPDENDPTVLRFRTKGVSNDQEDGSLVHYRNVIGKPVFTIPYLGYVANYIQNPPGTYISICIGAILLFLVFLPDLFNSDDGKKKDSDKNEG